MRDLSQQPERREVEGRSTLDVRIELGRTHVYLDDVMTLRAGAVLPLDQLDGEPVDVYVDGRLVARGDVLVLHDNYCVRVTELVLDARAAA